MSGSGEARSGRVAVRLERQALVISLVGVIMIFSLLPSTADTFLTWSNTQFVLNNQAVPVLVGLAVTVPLICGEFDLSVGSVAALAAVVAAAGMTRFDLPSGVAVGLAVLISSAVGLVNGLLVARVGINSIVATLGVSSMIVGGLTWYTKGQNVLGGFSSDFLSLGRWPRPPIVLVTGSFVAWSRRRSFYRAL